MTLDEIRNAGPKETIWDKGSAQSVSGLHLRVSPAGKKIFMLYYRAKTGQQRRPKIGQFGEITLAEARRRAKVIMDRVSVGEDPRADWEMVKAEPTVSDLFNRVREEYWNSPRFLGSRHLECVDSHWRRHLKQEFGNLKVSEVTRDHVVSWHRTKSSTPYAANRCVETLSTLFRFAEQWNYRALNTNPCQFVKSYTEKARGRYATNEELAKIVGLLEEHSYQYPQQVAFLYLLMLTGSRPSAIARAKPSQVQTLVRDGNTFGVLSFHGKTTAATGENEIVIIPPQAMKIIERLPQSENGTLLNCYYPRQLWETIREQAGCKDLWMRDFRRLFASVGLSKGVNEGTIGALLNHKSTQTTKRYARLMYESRVAAASQIAGHVSEMIASAKRDK